MKKIEVVVGFGGDIYTSIVQCYAPVVEINDVSFQQKSCGNNNCFVMGEYGWNLNLTLKRYSIIYNKWSGYLVFDNYSLFYMDM